MPVSAPTRTPTPRPRSARPTGLAVSILLRFVSCGLLSLAGGLTWRLALAPRRETAMSAVGGLLFLLGGFIAGGVFWYAMDARARSQDAGRVSDERLIFSFVVFALIPLCVLALVALVWMATLIIGVR